MNVDDLIGKEIDINFINRKYFIENKLSDDAIEKIKIDCDTYVQMYSDTIWWIITRNNKNEFPLNQKELKYLLQGLPAKICGDKDAALYIQLNN